MVAVHLAWQDILGALLGNVPVDELVLAFVDVDVFLVEDGSPLERRPMQLLAPLTMTILSIQRLLARDPKLDLLAETGSLVKSVKLLVGLGE